MRELAKGVSLGQTGVFKTLDEKKKALKRQREIPLDVSGPKHGNLENNRQVHLNVLIALMKYRGRHL